MFTAVEPLLDKEVKKMTRKKQDGRRQGWRIEGVGDCEGEEMVETDHESNKAATLPSTCPSSPPVCQDSHRKNWTRRVIMLHI